MLDAPRPSDGPLAVETRLVATPAAAGAARRFIADTLLDRNADKLLDDVVLCGSELVTNAVLHAGGSLVLRLSFPDDDVLLEVIDEVPMDRSAVETSAGGGDDDHMTGRGLAVLATVAAAWGVDRSAMPGAGEGKVVWARLSVAARPTADHDDADGERRHADTARRAERRALRPLREAELIDVPAKMFLASEAHLDDVLRELLLAWWASPDDETMARLASRLDLFLASMAQTRATATAGARDGLAAGEDRVTLLVSLDPEVVAGIDHFIQTMDEVEGLARFGLLLTTPAPPELAAFRRWYVGELRRQSAGSAPLPCPFA